VTNPLGVVVVLPDANRGVREDGAVPVAISRFDLVCRAPVYLARQPWPRRQSDMRRVTGMLRNRLIEHVVEPKGVTGRHLPGPIPGLSEQQLLEGLHRDPFRRNHHDD
jgi:1-acyl-sn-glycerol-3-phosphate acyltransferase